MNSAQHLAQAFNSGSFGVGEDDAVVGQSFDEGSWDRVGEANLRTASEKAASNKMVNDEGHHQKETVEDLDCFDVLNDNMNEVLDAYESDESMITDSQNILGPNRGSSNRSSFNLDAFSLNPEEISNHHLLADVSAALGTKNGSSNRFSFNLDAFSLHPQEISAHHLLTDVLEAPVALDRWIELEKGKVHEDKALHRTSLLRKLYIAYGIGTLLFSSPDGLSSVSNFAVRESSTELEVDSEWEVMRVDMIAPSLSVRIIATPVPENYSGEEISNDKPVRGRHVLAVVVNGTSTPANPDRTMQDEMPLCQAFGELLHELFSGEPALTWQRLEGGAHKKCSETDEHLALAPLAKKTSRDVSFSQATISEANITVSDGSNSQLKDAVRLPSLDNCDCPSSISQLVDDLLSCNDALFRPDTAFSCLSDAIDEIALLIEEPNKLLFSSSASHQLKISNGKLFGRSAELSELADVYHRVTSTGVGEAVLVGGFSGSGKTRLVQEVIRRIVGDYAVERKFEETSTQSSLTTVLSAFNDICSQISQNKSQKQLNLIRDNLIKEFGNAEFERGSLLTSILPNIMTLIASDTKSEQPVNHQVDSSANLTSLCFTLQRFMKVISLTGISGVIFFDDIQWGEEKSIGIIHSVLSNDEAPSLLLIGSYRTYSLQESPLVPDFTEMLSRSRVPVTTVQLGGMPEADVNMLVSNVLLIVPRLCKPLTAVIVRKTAGLPFHIQAFLQTLFDRGLLNFSLRKKRFVFDLDSIAAEPVANDVVQLITKKMNTLSNDVQTILKISSCFGIKVSTRIMNVLSRHEKFSSICFASTMNLAVREGFMETNGPLYYEFVHDKVRESAYNLIECDRRDQFHFEIGMALLPSCINQDTDFLYTVVEQVNYGVPSFFGSISEQVSIAHLNYEAGLAAMKCWNFVGALAYLKAAHILLPVDCWDSHYDLSIVVHFQLANAAYPCAAMDIARNALTEIDLRAKCLEDKIDANYLLVKVLHHDEKDPPLAISICRRMLNLLGEYIPDDISETAHRAELMNTRMICACTTSEHLMNMSRTECKRLNDIARFYVQLAFLSYTHGNGNNAKGYWLCGYFTSRGVSFCLKENVVCRETPVLLSFYSGSLGYGFNEMFVREGYRLGKIAVAMVNRSGCRTELPRTYLSFYGYIAVLFEPIQACAEQHLLAFRVAMEVGSISDAFFHIGFAIQRKVEAGVNLRTLEREVDSCQQLAKSHDHPLLATYMHWYKDTVSSLINGSGSSLVCDDLSPGETKITDAYAINIARLIMLAFYLGRAERVIFLVRKWEESIDIDTRNKIPLRTIFVAFYHGLALAMLYRQRKNKWHLPKIRADLVVLTKATSFSEWNFKNKLALVEAELMSIEGGKDDINDEAAAKYDVAIKSARSSKFVHEEGLACELAGKHYERKGCIDQALELFNQAEKCYQEWGVRKRVNQVAESIRRLSEKGSA